MLKVPSLFVATVIPFPSPSPSSLYFTPAKRLPSVLSFFVKTTLYFGVFSTLKFSIPLESVVACVMLYSFKES